MQAPADGTLRVTLDGLTGDHYLTCAEARAPRGAIYRLSCEARTSGAAAPAPLGLGLIDLRGWAATKSGMAIDTLAEA